jgi:hypothetical protein
MSNSSATSKPVDWMRSLHFKKIGRFWSARDGCPSNSLDVSLSRKLLIIESVPHQNFITRSILSPIFSTVGTTASIKLGL